MVADACWEIWFHLTNVEQFQVPALTDVAVVNYNHFEPVAMKLFHLAAFDQLHIEILQVISFPSLICLFTNISSRFQALLN